MVFSPLPERGDSAGTGDQRCREVRENVQADAGKTGEPGAHGARTEGGDRFVETPNGGEQNECCASECGGSEQHRDAAGDDSGD